MIAERFFWSEAFRPIEAPLLEFRMQTRLLPGRVAVLVPNRDPREGGIFVPEAVWSYWERLDKVTSKRREVMLVRGQVVAVGAQRGRVKLPGVGETVLCEAKSGLIIDSGDVDIPSLGKYVPRGYTLRLYGVANPWYEDVVCGIAE